MLLERRSAEQQRVLVVEPNDLVAAGLKAQLERLGHLVLGSARDGREAIAAAQWLDPSLVLMETKLPGSDGIDTARAIVVEQPVPVILLTHYAGAEFVRRAKEAGVVAYLTAVEQRRLRSTIEVHWSASESSGSSGGRRAIRTMRWRSGGSWTALRK